jgi:hypothetical protein
MKQKPRMAQEKDEFTNAPDRQFYYKNKRNLLDWSLRFNSEGRQLAPV